MGGHGLESSLVHMSERDTHPHRRAALAVSGWLAMWLLLGLWLLPHAMCATGRWHWLRAQHQPAWLSLGASAMCWQVPMSTLAGASARDPHAWQVLAAWMALGLSAAWLGAARSGLHAPPGSCLELIQGLSGSRSLHGRARFAHRRDLAARDMLGPRLLPDATPPTKANILLGRWGRHALLLPAPGSALLSAPTRSGKGVSVVLPNLLCWPDSLVVLDIKGENHALSAGWRAQCGHAVYAFAPFSATACSHRWNPLDCIRDEPLHRVGDALALAEQIYPQQGLQQASENFFNDQARNAFLGLVLYLKDAPHRPCTMGELLRVASGEGRSIAAQLRALLQERQSRLALSKPGVCDHALMRLLANSDNTLSNIISTCLAPLTLFADPLVDAATSASDFQLERLRQQRLSIYLCIPPARLASAQVLLRLFFCGLVALNTRVLPQDDPASRHSVLLLLDEFASLGQASLIADAAAFLAGYHIRLLTVVQAMSQLDAIYGERRARAFATNHAAHLVFAPREQRDAQEYSAMLGHFGQLSTSQGGSRSLGRWSSASRSWHASEQRRPLLYPQEFKALGAEQLVVMAENCPPIVARKLRYHEDPQLRQRLLPAPTIPALPLEPCLLGRGGGSRSASSAAQGIGGACMTPQVSPAPPPEGELLERLAQFFAQEPPAAVASPPDPGAQPPTHRRPPHA